MAIEKDLRGGRNRAKVYKQFTQLMKKEVSRIVVGQERVLDGVLRGVLSKGHVLLEGLPGIAKTLITKAIAGVSGCSFNRVQFTVDLLPTDITGITSYDKNKGFFIVKGPIFANFVLADEINRAPPKTQSALLEAMQEKQVTIGKETMMLEEPFFVLANNNPIESSGVYTLPEAQLDRFLFKILVYYPEIEEEIHILRQNMTLRRFEDYNIKPVITPKRIIEMQDYTRDIFTSEDVERYIVMIVNATREPEKYKIALGKYIEYGSSPRASIGLYIASKADALINGNEFVKPHNVKNIAYEVLRHRILLNYEGQAEGIKSDDVIKEILSKVPVP